MGVHTDETFKKMKYEVQAIQSFDWRNIWLKKEVPDQVDIMFMPYIIDDRKQTNPLGMSNVLVKNSTKMSLLRLIAFFNRSLSTEFKKIIWGPILPKFCRRSLRAKNTVSQIWFVLVQFWAKLKAERLKIQDGQFCQKERFSAPWFRPISRCKTFSFCQNLTRLFCIDASMEFMTPFFTSITGEARTPTKKIVFNALYQFPIMILLCLASFNSSRPNWDR